MSFLKRALEGKPLRSPLHPALVHFPIALFTLGFFLDLTSWVVRRPEWLLVPSAYYATVLGIITAVVAALFGFVDYTTIRRDHPAKKTASVHMVLNIVALALFALSAIFRHDALGAARTPSLPFWITTLAMMVLSYSGYLGGAMVYDDGVGVGRHRRRQSHVEPTIKAPPRPEEKKVLIANATDLKEGEMLRVEAQGTILVVARTQGKLTAFQEFCPHRYGPLSEGQLERDQITCPWHCSRFNVHTGKVMAGPAKIDLRTFQVEEHDGNLWLALPASESSKPPAQ